MLLFVGISRPTPTSSHYNIPPEQSWIYPRYLRPGFSPLWLLLGGKTGTNETGLSVESGVMLPLYLSTLSKHPKIISER